jgi:imidazolonepropionase-like amidohydrolase
MTGGHGDFRQMSESRHNHGYCSCGDYNSCCVIADGVDECIKAVREELRRGAHCIKIMAPVASPADRPDLMHQYREDEIRAIVNETTERRTYVAAHCHPASAVRRCVEFGVRSIEHGTLIDDDTARFVAERGAYIVPTMVVIFVLVEMGRQLGFPPVSQEKAEYAYKQALSGMDKMRKAGVLVSLSIDNTALPASVDPFGLMRQLVTLLQARDGLGSPFGARQALQMATLDGARDLGLGEVTGSLTPGKRADVILIRTADLNLSAAGEGQVDRLLMAAQPANVDTVMVEGRLVKRGGALVGVDAREIVARARAASAGLIERAG